MLDRAFFKNFKIRFALATLVWALAIFAILAPMAHGQEKNAVANVSVTIDGEPADLTTVTGTENSTGGTEMITAITRQYFGEARRPGSLRELTIYADSVRGLNAVIQGLGSTFFTSSIKIHVIVGGALEKAMSSAKDLTVGKTAEEFASVKPGPLTVGLALMYGASGSAGWIFAGGHLTKSVMTVMSLQLVYSFCTRVYNKAYWKGVDKIVNSFWPNRPQKSKLDGKTHVINFVTATAINLIFKSINQFDVLSTVLRSVPFYQSAVLSTLQGNISGTHFGKLVAESSGTKNAKKLLIFDSIRCSILAFMGAASLKFWEHPMHATHFEITGVSLSLLSGVAGLVAYNWDEISQYVRNLREGDGVFGRASDFVRRLNQSIVEFASPNRLAYVTDEVTATPIPCGRTLNEE